MGVEKIAMLNHDINDIREFYKSNLDFLNPIQMKIPYKLIQERLDLNPSIDQLSDILFQLGHEHEIKNNVFEMEFIIERLFSLDGLLRDIAFFYNQI